MAMGLLQAATVTQGDGDWTGGYEIESWGCGVGEYITDICTPSPIHVTGADYLNTPTPIAAGRVGSVKIVPFACVAGIAREVRHGGSTPEAALVSEFLAASELPIATMFGGLPSDPIADEVETLWTTASVDKPSVTAVASGTDLRETIKNLVQAAATKRPDVRDMVLHMGVDAAFLATLDVWATIGRLGLKVAISLGYTPDLLALTGPITVRLGSIQSLKTNAPTKNEVFFEATRLAAIEFDPCLAFRAA